MAAGDLRVRHSRTQNEASAHDSLIKVLQASALRKTHSWDYVPCPWLFRVVGLLDKVFFAKRAAKLLLLVEVAYIICCIRYLAVSFLAKTVRSDRSSTAQSVIFCNAFARSDHFMSS